jgi:hypothetical protein
MRSIVLIILVVFSLTIPMHNVAANIAQSNNNDAHHAITEFNNQRQRLINSPNFFHEAVNFYHHHIHEHASFEVIINDQRSHIPPQKRRLNKTEFLQSFLDEGQRLRSYKQNYDIISLESNQAQPNSFTVKEKIFEQGILPSFQMGDNSSVSFSTMSFCTSTYQVNAQSVMQTGSSCQTNVAFPEEI